MIKFISLLLIFTQLAQAGLPPTSIQGQSDSGPKTKFAFQVPNSQATDLGGIKSLLETGNKNLLSNPSFEASSFFSSWGNTVSFSQALETSVVSDGKQSAKITVTANTGSMSNTTTPTIQVAGQNMEASCSVQTTNPNFQLCSDIGTGTVTNCVNIPATGNFTRVTSNFIGPSSGFVGVYLSTTASTTGTLYVDDCYVGPARNVGTVAQATLLGTVVISGCAAAFTGTSTTLADFATQTGCTYTTTGQALAPTTNIPGIRFNSIPPGEIRIEAEGEIGQNAAVSSYASYQFSDGTNNTRETSYVQASSNSFAPNVNGTLSYTTAQSNVTLRLRYSVGSGATAYVGGGGITPLTLRVYLYPSQSQQAYKPDQTPASYSGYLTTSTNWSTTSTTYADFGTGTGVLNAVTNRNITCTAATGTIVGFVCNLPAAGIYNVGMGVNHTLLTTSGTVSTRLVDGSGTLIDPGKSLTVTAGNNAFMQLSGQYLATAAGSVTFKVQSATSAGTLYIVNGNAAGSGAVNLTLSQSDTPLAAPYLTGSVTSTTLGGEHVERAYVSSTCTASPCTITNQSGNWVTSIVRNSLGNYTVNIASGEFSGIPSCSVTANGLTYYTNVSQTAFSFQGNTSAGAASDVNFSVQCMGPR